jgi:hypothetical protein
VRTSPKPHSPKTPIAGMAEAYVSTALKPHHQGYTTADGLDVFDAMAPIPKPGRRTQIIFWAFEVEHTGPSTSAPYQLGQPGGFQSARLRYPAERSLMSNQNLPREAADLSWFIELLKSEKQGFSFKLGW